MAPKPSTQIGWGLGAALAVILIVAVLALVPDPFFQHRAFATRFDDVEGVGSGTPVFFRGASVGEVRSVALDPESRTFDVKLSVLKTLHPSDCSYVSVASANPFTAPHIEIVAIEKTPAGQCRTALAEAGCASLTPPREGGLPITGCRRAPDLLQTATTAVAQAAKVATVANQMAQRLQAMMSGPGGTTGGLDAMAVARNASQTVASLQSLSNQLNRSFTPGRGDIALTLANLRQMSGRAATVDVASINGILQETRTMIAQNQASIKSLLSEANAGAGQARSMLEDASASLVTTSANLQRASDNLSSLTEHVSADPTFAIRGQKFTDPPAPGSKK